jgi:hypothetical protein
MVDKFNAFTRSCPRCRPKDWAVCAERAQQSHAHVVFAFEACAQEYGWADKVAVLTSPPSSRGRLPTLATTSTPRRVPSLGPRPLARYLLHSLKDRERERFPLLCIRVLKQPNSSSIRNAREQNVNRRGRLLSSLCSRRRARRSTTSPTACRFRRWRWTCSPASSRSCAQVHTHIHTHTHTLRVIAACNPRVGCVHR